MEREEEAYKGRRKKKKKKEEGLAEHRPLTIILVQNMKYEKQISFAAKTPAIHPPSPLMALRSFVSRM